MVKILDCTLYFELSIFSFLGGVFSLLSKTLTVASWTSYGVSMSATVYHAIRQCKDYRPKPCEHPTCKYLSPCPDFLCQSPEDNKDYVDKQKEKTKEELNHIDDLLLEGKVTFHN